MARKIALSMLLLTLTITACQPTEESADDPSPAVTTSIQDQATPQWAQEHLSAWYAAHNAEDVAAKASLYAPETVRLPPNGEPLRGRDSLEKVFAENFRTTRSECRGEYDGIRVMGNLATGWGHDTCTSTPKSGGATETTYSRWLSVFDRQGDEWLIVYETWEEVDQ